MSKNSSLDGIQLEKYIARDLVNDYLDFTLFSSFFLPQSGYRKSQMEVILPLKTLSGIDTFQINGGVKGLLESTSLGKKWVRNQSRIRRGESHMLMKS